MWIFGAFAVSGLMNGIDRAVYIAGLITSQTSDFIIIAAFGCILSHVACFCFIGLNLLKNTY